MKQTKQNKTTVPTCIHSRERERERERIREKRWEKNHKREVIANKNGMIRIINK